MSYFIPFAQWCPRCDRGPTPKIHPLALEDWEKAINDVQQGRNYGRYRHMIMHTSDKDLLATGRQLIDKGSRAMGDIILQQLWIREMKEDHVDIHGLADWWPDWFIPPETPYGTIVCDPLLVSWCLSDIAPAMKMRILRCSLRALAATGCPTLFAGTFSEVFSHNGTALGFEVCRIQMLPYFSPPRNSTKTMGPSYDLLSNYAQWAVSFLNAAIEEYSQAEDQRVIFSLSKSRFV